MSLRGGFVSAYGRAKKSCDLKRVKGKNQQHWQQAISTDKAYLLKRFKLRGAYIFRDLTNITFSGFG